MSGLSESITYNPKANTLQILNQLYLPLNIEFEQINNTNDAWEAIKSMKVRGAPAIALLGLLSVSIELGKYEDFLVSLENDPNKLYEFIQSKANYLCTSRPTAVNIRKEFDGLLNAFVEHRNSKASKRNRSKVNVLTHCNTGSLATASYGTALGVIRSLNRRGQIECVYCTETRPYNQGSRLTAWELINEDIPSTLICDNMVAALMSTKQIDAVVVGADRVVANGDTANKIGTYQIAILCKHFGVPFYVASPCSTLDFSLENGSKITIEERPPNEMRFIKEVPIAPLEMNCWNPAFDVTPANLITGGIITEDGVISPDQLLSRFS
ncbi:hypothetical protein RDWZM_004201 [Blomia tropicalis]|uniref:Methylthioribose-1-phosphate isomerase n=1 Tax=Blomia tropicalis TaxID=40697 RepID=A0A9Q0RTP7_BLOTA|nr:hypothetical protein RDWZM_004201 [Blomia tropicalis]